MSLNGSCQKLFQTIGLDKGFFTGVKLALLSVSPMLLYSLIWGTWDDSISLMKLFNIVVIGAFFEELFFRGFLLGQLFRYAKWGFILAGLIVTVIFGCGHLYEGTDIVSSIMAGLVTGLESLLFGWIFIECKYNLWCSIFLHMFMNFAWSSFAIADNEAVGDITTNVFRILTVVMAIMWIVIYKRKNNIPYYITKVTLWTNK